MKSPRFERNDLDNDGVISTNDIMKSEKILELELREEKAETHRKMAWLAMLSMVIITIVIFLPNFINESRLQAIGDIITTFYLAQASVVGFYFGANAFMSKR